MTDNYVTRRKYKLVVLPPLKTLIPNLEQVESEMLDLLNQFIEITGLLFEYDYVTPIEFLIMEILHCVDFRSTSLRELEVDAAYVYSELSTMIYQEAEDQLDGELHTTSDEFVDLVDSLTDVLVPVALKFWEHIRKSDAIVVDQLQNICELVIHDLEEACVIQYLTHTIERG